MTECNMIFYVAESMHSLRNMKFFVKNSVRYLPGVGYALQELA